jgi:ferric-dicitrate binding protein FerR (iron transport regulator)
MTEKERNAFEKELQKDPFAEEASEGFSSVDTEAAGRDLADLNRRMGKRISAGTRRLWYGIAASVTVLLAISAILVLNRPENRLKKSRITSLNAGPASLPSQRQNP